VNVKKISLVADFTDCPIGRFRENGVGSGEAFREDILKPALAEGDLIEVDLNGADCLPPGFLDEAFGILAKELGRAEFERRVKIVLTDDRIALVKLQDSIRLRTA
jgi:hypothetical protein